MMVTKQTVWGTREYVLRCYGDWYWQGIGNVNDTWGNYGSRIAAVEAARKAGYTIA